MRDVELRDVVIHTTSTIHTAVYRQYTRLLMFISVLHGSHSWIIIWFDFSKLNILYFLIHSTFLIAELFGGLKAQVFQVLVFQSSELLKNVSHVGKCSVLFLFSKQLNDSSVRVTVHMTRFVWKIQCCEPAHEMIYSKKDAYWVVPLELDRQQHSSNMKFYSSIIQIRCHGEYSMCVKTEVDKNH